MTEFQKLLQALEARGKLAAKVARARAVAALVAAAPADVTAELTDKELVALTAPGLYGRAYGTRRRMPDAAVQSLVRR